MACPASIPSAHLPPVVAWLHTGNDLIIIYAQAATLFDRILRGEKPTEISVQQPAKFEMVINLKQ